MDASGADKLILLVQTNRVLIGCCTTNLPPGTKSKTPIWRIGVEIGVNSERTIDLLCRFSFLVSRFSFLVSRFSFLVSRFSFLVSRFSFLVSRFSFLVSRFSFLVSRFSFLVSRFSFLVSRFSFLVSRFSFLVSRCDRAYVTTHVLGRLLAAEWGTDSRRWSAASWSQLSHNKTTNSQTQHLKIINIIIILRISPQDGFGNWQSFFPVV